MSLLLLFNQAAYETAPAAGGFVSAGRVQVPWDRRHPLVQKRREKKSVPLEPVPGQAVSTGSASARVVKIHRIKADGVAGSAGVAKASIFVDEDAELLALIGLLHMAHESQP